MKLRIVVGMAMAMVMERRSSESIAESNKSEEQ